MEGKEPAGLGKFRIRDVAHLGGGSPAFWLNLKEPLSTWLPSGTPAAPQTEGVSSDMGPPESGEHRERYNSQRCKARCVKLSRLQIMIGSVMWRRCLIVCKSQKQGMYVIWRRRNGGV